MSVFSHWYPWGWHDQQWVAMLIIWSILNTLLAFFNVLNYESLKRQWRAVNDSLR